MYQQEGVSLENDIYTFRHGSHQAAVAIKGILKERRIKQIAIEQFSVFVEEEDKLTYLKLFLHAAFSCLFHMQNGHQDNAIATAIGAKEGVFSDSAGKLTKQKKQQLDAWYEDNVDCKLRIIFIKFAKPESLLRYYRAKSPVEMLSMENVRWIVEATQVVIQNYVLGHEAEQPRHRISLKEMLPRISTLHEAKINPSQFQILGIKEIMDQIHPQEESRVGEESSKEPGTAESGEKRAIDRQDCCADGVQQLTDELKKVQRELFGLSTLIMDYIQKKIDKSKRSGQSRPEVVQKTEAQAKENDQNRRSLSVEVVSKEGSPRSRSPSLEDREDTEDEEPSRRRSRSPLRRGFKERQASRSTDRRKADSKSRSKIEKPGGRQWSHPRDSRRVDGGRSRPDVESAKYKDRHEARSGDHHRAEKKDNRQRGDRRQGGECRSAGRGGSTNGGRH